MAESGGANASQAADFLANLRSPSTQPHNNTTSPRASAPTDSQAGSGQMANPLLQLLKFGPASPQTSPSPAPVTRPSLGSPGTHSVHGRGISASDLVSSFSGAKSPTPTPRDKPQAAASANHQDALLRLLNQTTARPEGGQHRNSGSTETPNKHPSEDLPSSSVAANHPSVSSVKSNPSSRRDSPIRFFGSNDESMPTPFDPVVSPKADSTQKNGSIFTYINPFEQLAASSPRNAKPKLSANGDKRKTKSPSPAAVHASSRRKLTSSGSELFQSIESQPPVNAKGERSQIEALTGIGAPTRDAETVAEALNEVGDKVDQQVESALAKAEEAGERKEQGSQFKEEGGTEEEQRIIEDIQSSAHDIAVDVKKELDKDENQELLKESMPTPMAEAVKDVIDEAASEKVADEYENAEGEKSNSKHESSRDVPVYQFPMKPFVSISLIQKEPPYLSIREDAVMHVARFKKDFDQADRTLATASNEFIVYGMPKNGGIRIIQQDNGQNSSIFSKSQDRIFNVAISTAQPGSTLKSTQTVIATGVSGTVYWTTIAKPGEEFDQDSMEKQGLIIPPVSSQSDSTPGGQLKTRAKKSSRHPEFFAIGRGKSIQIIFTAHASNSELVTKEGLMDSDKYFASRNLKVTTGKAGKDFTFSEDDSTIVTLDKAGKLRIWDIRELTNEANAAMSLMTPIEVKAPILTFNTAHSTEKSWPTSVLFVDKLRPYTKGTALRYIIVGMKQNHTLQLWDLCLGKAVQELSFPHESESDAICSVTYHPASGIIAVGHPTRNSIYFIHLSAPKYNLPPMPQAKFVQRLANKDTTLPKPEATAIMSGIREYAFAEKGQIRSIELVPTSGELSRAAEDEEDPTMFELYVMHSKGVTCLGIKKEDLGWSKDSRVLQPINAEKEGLIDVRELREVLASSVGEPSATIANGESQNPASPPKPKSQTKENSKPGRALPDVPKASNNTTEKADKKKSKRNAAGDADLISKVAETPPPSDSFSSAAQPGVSSDAQATSTAAKDSGQTSPQKPISGEDLSTKPTLPNDRPTRPLANGDSINIGISSEFLDKELKKIERGVSDEFNKVISRELEILYRRFSEDKRVQDAAGAAKQDAMLRLVSSTLSENVEKSLSRIIRQNIQDSVVPSISNVTSSVLEANLSTTISHQVDEKMATILKQVLPDTIGRTLQSQQFLHPVSEQVTRAITNHVDREFAAALDKTIIPAFTGLAVNLAQKVTGDTERRVREQLQGIEAQRQEDNQRIEQLTNLVRGLSETLHAMAAAQSDFQVEILKQQQKAAENTRSVTRQHSPTPSESASMVVSPEQQEIDAVTNTMNEGRFEDATVMWLQSQQQVQLFDNLFVRCDPMYLRHISPLAILSVGVAVTNSLESNTMERLIWLETVFRLIDTRDPEIREVAGRILEVLSQRLEGEYMNIAENKPQSPALRKIPGLARLARELRVNIP
ncbi:hypothetical protein ACLMJK_002127 [Lecanora helva]